MPTKAEIYRYMELLAKSLQLIDRSDVLPSELFTVFGFQTYAKRMKKQLDSVWQNGYEELFQLIEGVFEKSSICDGERISQIVSICMWMDNRICYEISSSSEKFSIYPLLHLSGDKPVFVDALNLNYEETGIWINPKFKTGGAYENNSERKLSNRDVFEGFNGYLKNISFIRWKSGYFIHNVIIPNDFILDRGDDSLRIAFAPMSDKRDLLNKEKKNIKKKNILFEGRSVKSVNFQMELAERFKADWRLACECKADILFAPEMLGLPEMEQASYETNTFIQELNLNAFFERINPPAVTFLPGFWSEGTNRVMVVYQDGMILGTQYKYIPYVDVKDNWEEALENTNEKHFLVLHIPDAHRIVIMICAEFLASQSQRLQEFICGQLEATLVIVPSYSQGEQDFVNSLSSFKPYGTTVVWGNCCGAIGYSPRIIGGCSMAGTDQIDRFGENCKCRYSCDKYSACIFLVSLPIHFCRQKPHSANIGCVVKHFLYDKKTGKK